MHAVMISFQSAGTELNRDGAEPVFPPTTDTMPGLLESQLLLSGPRQAWFLLFRDRRTAELALRLPAITRLMTDPSRWNIFVEQFDAISTLVEPELVDREPVERDPSLLVVEQPAAVAH